VRFSWDPAKARANFRKHGVGFEEAATVFLDPLARIHGDPDHSFGEVREIIIGHAASGRVLLVSFTEHGDTLRVIHARQADRHERQDYEENK